MIEEIARTKSSAVSVFADFCRMAACAVACQSREEEYLEMSKRYAQEELLDISRAFAGLVDEMTANPFADFLGPYYTGIASKSTVTARGEFYTPPEISEMMARMITDVEKVIEEQKPLTVLEPASGSGGMILKLAKQFAPTADREKSCIDLLRVTCWDVSPLAADMAYINTTLWGIPAHIICGNTLSQEITHSWKNIHWHRVNEDSRQSFLQIQEFLSHPPDENAHPQLSDPNRDDEPLMQPDLFFE